MRVTVLVLGLLMAHAAQAQGPACGEASAPVGARTGGSFQVFLGAASQVYRICKRAAASPKDDCDVEVTSTFKRVAVLEKQPANGCACVDVDGTNIEVKTVPAGASCTAASATIWYENVRNR
ncbi:MAG TPA: hypothetical protein VLJ57_08555 [Burkholderiaceae bacterium]|nr:hypothetical protein [Burkholderiaceae bacterium]